MSDLHEDLTAAFAKVESGNTDPVTPSAPAAPATPQTVEVPVQRGADGRFASQTPAPAAPAPLGTPAPAPATPAATPPASGQPGAAPAAGTPAAPATPPAAGEGVRLDPAKPPNAWTPAMKEKWSTIPEDIRQEITRREEASAAGVQRLQKQYEPLDQLNRQVLAPNQQYFQHIQREPAEYLQEVMRIEQTLTLGNPAQKMQSLLDLADQYGVPLRQVVDTAMGGQLNTVMQQAHQQHQTPPAIPPAVAAELQQLRTAQAQIVEQAATAELNQFIGDGTAHPFFEQVKDRMADVLEAGAAKTYQEAYDMVVWSTPEIRTQLIAQNNGQAQLTGVAARQAAAAAVSTPPAAPIQGAPTNTDNDDLHETIRKQFFASGSV